MMESTNTIKSKISIKTWSWLLFMLFLILFNFFNYILKGILYIIENNNDKSAIYVTIFFTVLLFIIIYIIKDFKLLLINTSLATLSFNSLFNLFGKTIHFKDYKGIYKTQEAGSVGVYDVIYFVDHNNITRHKIMGLYYKNMDEIIQAIPLPVIKKSLSGKEYMKLMFTGRANFSKIKDKKNTDDKTIFYLKIFSAVTILIFIVGLLIRIFSKMV